MNKRSLLIVLGAVWIVILIYNFGLFGGGSDSVESGSRQERSRQVAAAKDFPVLKAGKLQKKRPSYKKVRKDIFSPFSSKRKVATKVADAPALTVTSDMDPLEKLISGLSFIGFVEDAREKTIFLGLDDDVVLVKKGISIRGLARVIEITDRKLILGDIYGASEKRYEISLE